MNENNSNVKNKITSVEGNLNASGKRFTIVLSRFNSFLTERLLEGAIDCLLRHGAKEESITIVRCPGAFEIPLTCKKVAEKGKSDAIIALGAVIRGDTPHFDFVASEVSKGIANLSMHTGLPIIFGVLTTDTIEQAEVRAGAKGSNKGFDAAMSAIEMLNLIDNL